MTDRRSDYLDPGLYLVGREDGLVEPFHVWVGEGSDAHCLQEIADELVQLAQSAPGWWWRLIVVPSTVPVDWSRFPKAMPSGMGEPDGA